MSNCFIPAPINPINEALMSVFGDNFFPPFNAGFQPTNKSAMANEKLFQFQFPGGGKAKPEADPHKSMSEVIAPLIGFLGSAFAFFGPLFIILDLIRAIIDILCSLINPGAMIASLVDMFLTVVPPVVALFPPLSSILLALNTIKLIIGIIVALTVAIVAIIDLIVENALGIAALINEGNIGAIESVTTKICTLIDAFANELGGLAPISFIIELINLFMSLGGKFFCASDAECCNSETCPPIILEPPTGGGTIGINLLSPEPLTSMTIFVSGISGSSDLNDLLNFIVDPSKIPSPAADTDPATVRVRITNVATNLSVTRRIITIQDDGFGLKIVVSGSPADLLFFPIDSSVRYEIIPDKTALLKVNLISLGCDDDVRAAAAGARESANETSVGISVVSGGTNRSGLESLIDKMGRSFPAPPSYAACLAAQQANPSISQAQCVSDISSAYLDELKDFALDLVCLGASRTKSEFVISRNFVPADGVESATISLIVRDANGANLLENFIPNASTPSDFTAEFKTTFGEIGPTIFDSEAGLFRASITATDLGQGTISAAFVIKGSTCMVPATFDGFTITDKVIDIEFQSAGGTFPRRRRQAQYIQSAGGRRR